MTASTCCPSRSSAGGSRRETCSDWTRERLGRSSSMWGWGSRGAHLAQEPLYQLLGKIGAEEARAQRVRQVPAERRMILTDPLDGAPNLVRHRLPEPLGGIAGSSGPAAQAVGCGQLVGDRLDLVA